MRAFPGTWWLIGGWAVDTWLGRQTREHPDVDLGLFRDEERQLFDYLPDWHLVGHDTPDAAHDDRWDGTPLGFPAHVHARHPDWPELDFNFNERQDGVWLVNRDPPLTADISEVILTSRWGIPTLAPELVLWHKGRGEIRTRDQQDFEALLPVLDARRRLWLASSLAAFDAHHAWLRRLGRTSEVADAG